MPKLKTNKNNKGKSSLEIQSFFDSIVENIPDMIFVKDAKDLKFELFNKAGERLLGRKREDLLGKSDRDFFPKSEADFFINKDREVLRSGKMIDIPVEPIKTPRGERFLHTKKIPLFGKKRKPEFLLGISEDITEKKRLEEELKARTEIELKESEEKFRKIFDNTNDAIVIHDLKGKVLEVNNSACKLLKYSKAEWLKLDASKVDSPEEVKKFPERVRRVLKEGNLLFETVHLTKDGKRIPVEVNARLVDFLGQKAILSVIRDITERKESEEKFKATVNNVPGMVYLAGPDWFADVLSGSKEICGYSLEDFKSKKVNWLDLIHPDDKNRVFKEGALLWKEKTSLVQVYRIIAKDKTIHWVEDHKNSVFGEDGKFKLIYGIVYDITSKKNAEERLKESEGKFKSLFEENNDAIFIADPKTKALVDCNRRAEKLIGYSKKQILKMTADQLHPKDIVRGTMGAFEKMVGGQQELFESEILTKSGKRIPVEINAKIISIGGVSYLQGIFRDLTERLKGETALKESEKKFRTLFEESFDGLFITSPDGRILDINKKGVQMFGYKAKEEMMKLDLARDVYVEPLDRKKILDVVNKKGAVEYDVDVKKKNGQVISTHCSLTAERDAKGRAISYRGIIRDVTKERELDRAKTEFLSLASHQLRTPLSATKWLLETIADDKNLTDKQRDKIRDLFVSNERLINLVNDLLDVTRIETGKLAVNPKAVDLRDLMDKLKNSLDPLAKLKNKEIIINFPSDLTGVFCDPLLFSESMENLIANALTYGTEASREVKISVEDKDSYYVVSVHNEGVIDPSIANECIFDKFVRGPRATEKQPSGSGLGLYLTKKAIEANGGKIWFETSVEKGTTFYLTILKANQKNYGHKA